MPSKKAQEASRKVKLKKQNNKVVDSPLLVSDNDTAEDIDEQEEKKESEPAPE